MRSPFDLKADEPFLSVVRVPCLQADQAALVACLAWASEEETTEVAVEEDEEPVDDEMDSDWLLWLLWLLLVEPVPAGLSLKDFMLGAVVQYEYIKW